MFMRILLMHIGLLMHKSAEIHRLFKVGQVFILYGKAERIFSSLLFS